MRNISGCCRPQICICDGAAFLQHLAKLTLAKPQPLDSFRPDRERAGAINRRLARKLSHSIAEIARACQGKVEFDDAAVERACQSIVSSGDVPTPIYMHYFDLLGAARRQDVAGLAALFDRLPTLSFEPARFRVVRWGDPDFDAQAARSYLGFVNIEPGSQVSFAEVDPDRFADACRLVERAFELLSRAAPEIEGEIKTLVRELVLVSGKAGEGMAFDGATSLFCWGALFLNAESHRTLVDMIDGLAHESAHAHLFGVSLGAAFVKNPPEDRHRSPLRVEPRPLDGIFHAAYVSARMHYAHSRLLDAGVLSSDDAAQAAESRELGKRAFWDGFTTLQAHAHLTALGGRVLAGARDYMAAAS